jgi:methylated-DNA-[protein]-cysteine S-methyltransferase
LEAVSVTCLPYAADDWGVGELWLEGRRLVWHELPRPRVETGDTPHPGWGSDPPPSRSTIPAKRAQKSNGTVPEVQQLVHRLGAYFRGEAVSFADVDIDGEEWTPFQQDVAAALRSVPYGEVVSYSDLARLAGYPRAQRAAGTFCARNRFPLVVPCHRVVGASGIGSYGSLGVDYKRRLLALEGVAL